MKKTKKVSKIEMISYAMKMVIPTGNYANIQPEIIVKAGTPEEALEYIAPHMNKLWKEYFLCGEKKSDQVVKPVVTLNVAQASANVAQVVAKTPEKEPTPSPVASVAYEKATQAVMSCLSLEALALIEKQVKESVKLEPGDKIRLFKLCDVRKEQLNVKKNKQLI